MLIPGVGPQRVGGEGQELPTIGGKANSMDTRLISGWHGLPLWKRDEIMRSIQQQNEKIEKEEAARRKQELAEKTAAMSQPAPKRAIESVPLAPDRAPSISAINPEPSSPYWRYSPDPAPPLLR